MSTPAATIVGVGMMTPVGLTARETAASVRAGTMRFSETQFRDRMLQPVTMAQVPDDGLPELDDPLIAANLTAREQRMLRLAALPIRECLAPLHARHIANVLPLCLALPETRTPIPSDPGRFVSRLALLLGGAIDPQRADASHVGRAGGLIAVGQAVATIQAGLADFVLAGAVDTYRDLYVLARLDADGRLKTSQNPDGFVPGEGAAFLLLANPQAAAAQGLATLARLSPVATGFESGHLGSNEPYRGDGLASTVAQLVASSAVEQPMNDVYSSMNGESHWAKEWGVTHIRNRAVFRPDHRMHHPADCFGETGAPAGVLMLGLAALGITASQRRGPALVYGSSDSGPRAALVVSAALH
jgi:3-oxoacyl-[acyl-carrier-protein] synthase-1